MSEVVSNASPAPAFTRSDTLSEILNGRNVPFLIGPVPTGIDGGIVTCLPVHAAAPAYPRPPTPHATGAPPAGPRQREPGAGPE